MKKIVTFLAFVLICTSSFAQTLKTSNPMFCKSNYNNDLSNTISTDNSLLAYNYNFQQTKGINESPKNLNLESSILLKPMNYSGLNMGSNFSNYSKNSNGGNKVGRFFLGALVGAASSGIAMIIMAGEPEGAPDNVAPWIIGGAVFGGVLFVIDF